MSITSRLRHWLERISSESRVIFAKRLAANDTMANATHQSGTYVAKPVAFDIAPSINTVSRLNPDTYFPLSIVSHDLSAKTVRLTYYNDRKYRPAKTNGRDEARITRYGGQKSPLLNPASTGALAVFAFYGSGSGLYAEVWLCLSVEEEEATEEWLGSVEPGHTILSHPGIGSSVFPTPAATCSLSPEQLPDDWRTGYPTGEDIIAKTLEILPAPSGTPDQLLMQRRQCEMQLFDSIQEAIELPRIGNGFSGLTPFLQCAKSIINRRKSRGGRSLELHVRQILIENGFVEGTHFDHDRVSEGTNRPDFVFPSQAAYRDERYSGSDLRMLAVKTSCRDRWRQILTEADRIPKKHLLTLQHGLSYDQFRQMRSAGVQLVVPAEIQQRYQESIRDHLLSLSDFLESLKSIPVRRRPVR